MSRPTVTLSVPMMGGDGKPNGKITSVTGSLIEWGAYLPVRFCVHRKPKKDGRTPLGWAFTELSTGRALYSTSEGSRNDALIGASEKLKDIGRGKLLRTIKELLSVQDLFTWGFVDQAREKQAEQEEATDGTAA